MKRVLTPYILKDLSQKIVLLTGPRQCGKTTLAKQLSQDYDYFNYDLPEHRIALNEQSWDRSKSLIIFDELHKMKNYKRWLKGIYDVEGIPPQLIVTGSAQLDSYRHLGDSLAGRYFQYRLHPLDIKEVVNVTGISVKQAFDQLFQCSGFPEPFLKADLNYYRRWRRTHLEIILRQDLMDLYAIRDIKSIETLVMLLKDRIGSTVSFANLARDLACDPSTVKRWLLVLENLYIVFRVTPYAKNITRSLLKEPKFYFYDITYGKDEGARLENMVACALLKELQMIEDLTGKTGQLHYLRNKDGREVDFLCVIDEKPSHLIEVKTSNTTPSKHLVYFGELLNLKQPLQLVLNIKREKTYPNGVEVRDLIQWLANFTLQSAH